MTHATWAPPDDEDAEDPEDVAEDPEDDEDDVATCDVAPAVSDAPPDPPAPGDMVLHTYPSDGVQTGALDEHAANTRTVDTAANTMARMASSPD